MLINIKMTSIINDIDKEKTNTKVTQSWLMAVQRKMVEDFKCYVEMKVAELNYYMTKIHVLLSG